jgi:predicted dehydrogenase
MKVLVVGLGSMGKRRIRNLLSIGGFEIFGFDIRLDRVKEAVSLYDIFASTNFEELIKENKFDAFIISVPPDLHHIYMSKSIELVIPCFVEASVVDTELNNIDLQSKEKNVLIAPSSTLRFHPGISMIREIMKNRILGDITNVLYHSGQYLPEWHIYEHVKEYYVSNRATGGAREIVPFELTWLTEVFGYPEKVLGLNKKTINIEGAESIDDTYNALFDYRGFIVNLSVDVVSRFATRNLVINGSEKQLRWDWNDGFIKIYEPKLHKWRIYNYEVADAQEGYNKNLTEQMYVDEMICFFNSIKNKVNFTNTLSKDIRVLDILYKLEKSQTLQKFIDL